MKITDLRDKTVEELKKELIALTREQLNLRIQKGAGQMLKLHLVKKTRRQIARIKTILTEKGFQV